MQSRPHSSVSAGQTQRPLAGSHAPEQHSPSVAHRFRSAVHARANPTVSGASAAVIPAAAPPSRVFSAPRRDVTKTRANSSNREPSTGNSDLASRIVAESATAGAPAVGLGSGGGSGSGHPPRNAFVAGTRRQ